MLCYHKPRSNREKPELSRTSESLIQKRLLFRLIFSGTVSQWWKSTLSLWHVSELSPTCGNMVSIVSLMHCMSRSSARCQGPCAVQQQIQRGCCFSRSYHPTEGEIAQTILKESQKWAIPIQKDMDKYTAVNWVSLSALRNYLNWCTYVLYYTYGVYMSYC
jgi:hypothetical protein